MPGSSITALDNPVADRVSVTVGYMLKLLATRKNDGGKASVGIKLGTKLVTEMMNDLKDSDMPPEIMGFYLRQLGAMIMWTATGERDESLPWPDDFEIPAS